MKKLILVAVVLSSTACSGVDRGFENMMTSSDKGRIHINADAAGMREFWNGANGLVVTGKATPDIQDAYHRQDEVKEATKQMKWQSKLAEIKAKVEAWRAKK